jgi:hypothetical protein
MLYRNIRKIATGEWVNIIFTSAGDSFSVPASTHVAEMAASLSLDASELEAVDGASDARTGTLIAQPNHTPPVASDYKVAYQAGFASTARKQELLAIGKDNWTDAQQKELIELLAAE